MFCSKCGAYAPDNSKYCSSCGASLFGAPILQIVKDAEGNETFQIISGENARDMIPEQSAAPAPGISVPGMEKKGPTADELYKDAEAVMKFSDYPLAVNAFKKLSAAYPDDWRGWFGELKAGILHHLSKARYDMNFTHTSLPDIELMKHALSCNSDPSLYAPFFREILPEWETKPHMYPFQAVSAASHGFCEYAPDYAQPSIDDRDVGAESLIRASRPNYHQYHLYAREGVWYNPDSFMCWFVKKGGIGDVIRLLGLADLRARVEGICRLFSDGYLSGSLIGANYCSMPELDQEAYRVQQILREDFNAWVRLLRAAGISCKYHQKAKKLIMLLPGARSEAEFDFIAMTVIGRQLELAAQDSEGYVNCYAFVFPENVDPKKYYKD